MSQVVFNQGVRGLFSGNTVKRPFDGSYNKKVNAIRPELADAMVRYQKIRDCLKGEEAVKNKNETYLPRPSGIASRSEDMRYQAYKDRASFLGATSLTQRTVVGKLTAKSPTVELPAQMEAMLDNVNGEGLAFSQLLEHGLGEVFAMGRGLFIADFENLPLGEISMADTRLLSPTIRFYRAEDIVNWRIDKTRRRLTMVVVREQEEEYDDFAVVFKEQYRVYVLDGERVKVQLWRDISSGDAYWYEAKFEVVAEYYLLLPGGAYWNEIPAAIAGSSNNDWQIDSPPLHAIALLDLSLMRNSADREDATFRLGQPTPYTVGVEGETEDDMELKNMRFGAGIFIPLPAGAGIGLLEAKPNTMIDALEKDKMKRLEYQGATIFSPNDIAVDQTATGAVFQALQAHAPLVTTGRNVVDALRKAVGYAAMFLGIDPETDEIEIKLNSDIIDQPLGVTGLQTVQQLYKEGLLTFDEAREQLRIQQLTLHDAEEAKELMAEEGLGDLGDGAPVADQEPVDFTDDDAPEVEQVMEVNDGNQAPPNG